MRPDGKRQTFIEALASAAHGVALAIRRERNVQIDCFLALAAVFLGFCFRIEPPQWVALVMCIGLVLAMELMNTALEAAVDLASPDMHLLAKRAKDCAAGACLIASACALVVGLLIFVPYIFDLLL